MFITDKKLANKKRPLFFSGLLNSRIYFRSFGHLCLISENPVDPWIPVPVVDLSHRFDHLFQLHFAAGFFHYPLAVDPAIADLHDFPAAVDPAVADPPGFVPGPAGHVVADPVDFQFYPAGPDLVVGSFAGHLPVGHHNLLFVDLVVVFVLLNLRIGYDPDLFDDHGPGRGFADFPFF